MNETERQLRIAIAYYEHALLDAFPKGASGNVFTFWNIARKVVGSVEETNDETTHQRDP